MRKDQGDSGDFLAAYAKIHSMILFLFRLLSRIPLRWLQAIGRIGGRLVYALPGRYRERLQANARQAGYGDPAFARRAAAQTGAMVMELPWVWLRTQESLKKIIDDNESLLDDAFASGRGVLILTPHLGGFEISGRHAAYGRDFTVMFRPPRKAALEPLVQVARQHVSMRAVPANLQGVRAFLKALRAGHGVGMLPDQVPREGDGVWAPFFGRQALTVTLPGKLAAATNPIVIMAACERLPKGQGWRMHYIQVDEPVPTDTVAQATFFNQLMEQMIRRFPEQYLWGYHRYKRPSHAPEPPADSLP